MGLAIKAANPRYFRRAAGLWHRTWSDENALRLTTTCGILMNVEGLHWAEICDDDGLPILASGKRCPRCFNFLAETAQNCP
jgi:hypothetical protein